MPARSSRARATFISVPPEVPRLAPVQLRRQRLDRLAPLADDVGAVAVMLSRQRPRLVARRRRLADAQLDRLVRDRHHLRLVLLPPVLLHRRVLFTARARVEAAEAQ